MTNPIHSLNPESNMTERNLRRLAMSITLQPLAKPEFKDLVIASAENRPVICASLVVCLWWEEYMPSISERHSG